MAPDDNTSFQSPSNITISEGDYSESASKKRQRKAINTWAHSRPPKDGEPKYKGRKEIFYYKYYIPPISYDTDASTNFRMYLLNKYNIKVIKDKN